MEKKGNMEFLQDSVIVSINPQLFSIDAVYMAANQMVERAYIILDGDLDTKILVRLIPKNKKELKTIGWEFSNELLSSQVYDLTSKKNLKIKEQIIEKALETLEMKDERDSDKQE